MNTLSKYWEDEDGIWSVPEEDVAEIAEKISIQVGQGS